MRQKNHMKDVNIPESIYVDFHFRKPGQSFKMPIKFNIHVAYKDT